MNIIALLTGMISERLNQLSEGSSVVKMQMSLSSQLLQAHGAGWILKGRDACERKAEAATSPPGSCCPSPFAFTSAMKAAFLPAALCPREGGGGVGSLHEAAGFFWFSP